jgi:diguanylate cyclase (GGDEF)-like protein/PAS domain S-box-containing protein
VSLIKDLDAVVTFWNREAALLYGFSAQEAIGKTLRELHAADLSAADYDRVLQRIRAGRPTSSTTERRKKSGEAVRVSLKTMPLRDGLGMLIGEITIARDITALYEKEQALRTAQETIRARMTAVRETAALLFPASSGSLFIFRESRDVLEHVTTWGSGRAPEATLAPDECWALRLGRPHFVPQSGTIRCRHTHADEKSYVCMPVQGQGQILGLLHVAVDVDAATRRPARDMEQRLRALTDRVGPALANLKLRDALRELALRDSLTGLYNRRYMEDALNREIHRAERSKKPVSVIMIDIDHFKHFNDKHGHDAGDFVLSAVARAIMKNIRPSDMACRYGGEELAVVLPEASLECACQRAETIRLAIRDTNLTHQGQTLPAPTASFGVAVYPAHGTKPATLLKSADGALYCAKHEGRDRVCVAAEAPAISSGD